MLIKDILQNEMQISVSQKRFKFNNYSYPIRTVLFERQNILGYFEPESYIIGVHKQMLYASPDDLRNLLRHELAHYLCFLHFGNQVDNHGKEYRALCKTCGWDRDVFLSKQTVLVTENQNQSEVLKKIQKLFALASSDNPHEAELATAKAKDLLIKHQLNYSDDDLEQFYMIRTLEGKRVQSKHYAISAILSEFNLLPVFNQAKGKFWLEITGSEEEIQVGEYLAFYLDTHLDELWLANQKKYQLKGLRAKNSFMTGVANGYVSKLKQGQASKTNTSQELMVLSSMLSKRSKLVYGRTSSTNSAALLNSDSLGKGQQAGKNLNIRAGLTNSSETFLLT